MKELTLPLDKPTLAALKAGDIVTLSGVIYTGRDAAHKRLCDMIEKGESLPFDLGGAIIYYTGPCPSKPGDIIGSCGPTTSYRMDAYAPTLYAHGAAGAIGKGVIGDGVKAAMREHGCVYFLATGGAGALLKDHVEKCEIIAFEELGPEAVRRLTVNALPLIVGVDSDGNDIYDIGKKRFAAE